MTLDEMKARANHWAHIGLDKDHQMLVLLIRIAELSKAAAGVKSYSLDALRQAHTELENLPS